MILLLPHLRAQTLQSWQNYLFSSIFSTFSSQALPTLQSICISSNRSQTYSTYYAKAKIFIHSRPLDPLILQSNICIYSFLDFSHSSFLGNSNSFHMSARESFYMKISFLGFYDQVKSPHLLTPCTFPSEYSSSYFTFICVIMLYPSLA